MVILGLGRWPSHWRSLLPSLTSRIWSLGPTCSSQAVTWPPHVCPGTHAQWINVFENSEEHSFTVISVVPPAPPMYTVVFCLVVLNARGEKAEPEQTIATQSMKSVNSSDTHPVTSGSQPRTQFSFHCRRYSESLYGLPLGLPGNQESSLGPHGSVPKPRQAERVRSRGCRQGQRLCDVS